MGNGKRTFYEILGVKSDISMADLNKVFRALVMTNHPDRFLDPAEKAAAERMLKDITEAYNTLSKPQARLQYDRALSAPQSLTSAKTPQEQSKDMLQQGLAKEQAGEYASALAMFDHAARLDPQNAEAIFHAGMNRLRTPRWRQEGSQQVEKAIAMAPYNAIFVTEYATFLIENGQMLKAQKLLEATQKTFKDDPFIPDLLARAKGQKGTGFSLFGKKK
jgi:DnaJ-class molecular chaperone